MNVTALFAFLVLVYGLAVEWTSNERRTFHAIVLSVLALIAALPVSVGLIDFLTSPRPKWRRFKYGWNILLWGDIFNQWQSEEKLKPQGKPIYCNPFQNSETFCDHRAKFSLLLPEKSKETKVLGNIVILYTLRPKRDLISSSPAFDFDGMSEQEGDFEVDVDALHVTIKVVKQDIREGSVSRSVCKLALTDTVINRTEISEEVGFNVERVRYFFDLVTNLLDFDRTCCFILDETRFVRKRKEVTAHCLSLHTIFKKVLSGHRAYAYAIRNDDKYDSDMCVCI